MDSIVAAIYKYAFKNLIHFNRSKTLGEIIGYRIMVVDKVKKVKRLLKQWMSHAIRRMNKRWTKEVL